MEILPISRNSFKILTCIDFGIYSIAKIAEVTRIPKPDIKASLAVLAEMKLIENKGITLFSTRVLTAEGIEALAVYSKVYGEDGDVIEVERELKEEESLGT